MPGKRRSVRLRNYDYTRQGAYYVTVCANDRKCVFGDVRDGEMVLNEYGEFADKYWNEIPEHFPHITLDEHITMPNHVHGILIITGHVGANNYSPLQNTEISSASSIQRPRGTSKTIGSAIRGFKIGVTKRIRQNINMPNLWQRNYYEHIIRNEDDLARIREYIMKNPSKWGEDEYYLSLRET
ncbi:MAG: hypothetical protein PHW14_06985 [Candidatus Omnitrophica bacterium]|nr:hypothetical protein [Candidatus Omnitrophota bacterium]